MTNKSLLWAGTLLLSVVALAAPKTYNVTLFAPMQAANVQLASGEYRVSVDGSNAVFTETQTHKSLTVPVTVETNSKKYSATALQTSKQGEMERLNAIELGGSTMKIEFAR